MKDFDAVVFDMDGVIFDSERALMDCWTELARKYGIGDFEKTYLACIGTNGARTKEIMLRAYGGDFPFEEYAGEASGAYHAKYDGGRLPVKRGARELLEYLERKGKRIALASSTRKQTVLGQLRDAHILEYFGAIVTGDMVSESKPAPAIFLRACEEIGVPPDRAYAVEDSYNGIRAARRGRLRPIMVPDLLPANEEMRELSEAVLDDLIAVVKYLEE